MTFGELKKQLNSMKGHDQDRVVLALDPRQLDNRVGFSSIGPGSQKGESVMVFVAADLEEQLRRGMLKP